MSELALEVEVHGDLIVVSQPGNQFTAIYAKPIANDQLIPMKRTSEDQELLARAWQLAKAKARERGWIT
jgi:hypothetical protein